MRLIEFMVELHGDRSVTINGRDSSRGEPAFEERVFFKQLELQQQWEVLCQTKKLLARINETYERSRVLHKEISEEDLKAARRQARKRAVRPLPFKVG